MKGVRRVLRISIGRMPAVVEIAASFPACHRCKMHINGGWARITNSDGEVILCYDPQKVSCYDAHLMDLEHGPF